MKLMFIILYSSGLSLAVGQLFQITPLYTRQGEKEREPGIENVFCQAKQTVWAITVKCSP